MSRLPVLEVVLEPLDGRWQPGDDDDATTLIDDPRGGRSAVIMVVAAAVTLSCLALLGLGNQGATTSADSETAVVAPEPVALEADPPPVVEPAAPPPSAPTSALAPDRSGQVRVLRGVDRDELVLMVDDEQAIVVDLDDRLGEVSSVSTTAGAVVVVQGAARATWFSRRDPGGLDLGPALAVYPATDGIWLETPGLVGPVVRNLVGDDEVMSAAVPAGFAVVGSTGDQFLLRDEPGRWLVWDPAEGSEQPAWVQGEVLATGPDLLATVSGDTVLIGRPTASPRWQMELDRPVTGPAGFSRNGAWLAVTTDSTSDLVLTRQGVIVEMLHRVDGTRLSIPVESVAELSVSDDGWLSVLTQSGELALFDDSGTLVRRFRRRPG